MMALAVDVEHPLAARCDSWGEAWRRHGRVPCDVVVIDGERTKRFFAKPNSVWGLIKSGPSWQWTDVPRTARPEPDMADAREIESAVCVLDLYHHAILRAWHVFRVSEPQCVRLAAKAAGEKRGRASGFGASLDMAYDLLGGALALPAVIRKDRARRRVQEAFAGVLDTMED